MNRLRNDELALSLNRRLGVSVGKIRSLSVSRIIGGIIKAAIFSQSSIITDLCVKCSKTKISAFKLSINIKIQLFVK